MLIRIYVTRAFQRSMKKSGVSDGALVQAVRELEQGLHDGDLGRGLFKKRIAFPGKGKRGSVRTIVVGKAGTRWFYLFGFKKNERADISEQELAALKMLARHLLSLDESALASALMDQALMEIGHGAH